MSAFRSQSGGDRRSISNEDEPPMSRLFVIGNKEHTTEEFRDAFARFGDVEDVWMVRDKKTGDSKGIGYVKFARTSDAAKAQEEMSGKSIGSSGRVIRVVVAANKNQGRSDNDQEKCTRLFIFVPKTATEEEIRNEFNKYGNVDSVSIVHDRNTRQPKGFAYVKFSRFYHAALAFENCPSKYKAVFAEPKNTRKSRRLSRDEQPSNNHRQNNNNELNNGKANRNYENMFPFNKMDGPNNHGRQGSQSATLDVICSTNINQDQLWRLFDIVPGLDYCDIIREHGPHTNEAVVVYNNSEAAGYAKEKIHGFEYPIGERIIIKFSITSPPSDQYCGMPNCNAKLPPPAPMAHPESPVARRLFIILSSSLPSTALRDVFCCFGGLIDIFLLPNRNSGYVRYARLDSAQNALDTLNGAEICGVKIKVMEAEEPNIFNHKRIRRS